MVHNKSAADELNCLEQ